MTNTIEFIIVFLCYLWVVSTLWALSSISPGMVRKMEAENRPFADKLSLWLQKREEYEIILRFLVLFAAGVFTVYCFLFYIKIFEKSPPYIIALLASATTFLLMLITEILFGILTRFLDVGILKISVPVLNLLKYSLFFPVLTVIMWVRRKINTIYATNDEEKKQRTSPEDEILSIVDKQQPSSGDQIDESEKKMIKGVLNLDDISVAEIMTPRVDVIGIPEDLDLSSAIKTIVNSGHSRVPVYKDTIDNIIGILFAKDLLDENKTCGKKISDLCRTPLFIPENKSVIHVMEEFKRKSNHFAVVIDEYGGTAGIITFEDVIEQIVGEIGDEYDTSEDILPDKTELSDGSIIFDGKAPFSKLTSSFNEYIEEEPGIHTVGGFISAKLGRIPETGEEFSLTNSLHATILKADKRKIIKVKIWKKK